MAIDPVAIAVVSWVGGSVTAGAGKYLADRVYGRLERTFGKAQRKADGDLDASDRVKVKVFGEAAFTDDDVTLEYLAGVLAASGPDDDRGAPIVGQISRLSADQLLFHYIVYRELRRLWPKGTPMNLYMQTEARKAGLRLDMEDLLPFIDPTRYGTIINALIRERLLDDHFQSGSEVVNGERRPTIQVRPSAIGAELFLWGHGFKDPHAARLLNPQTDIEVLPDVPETPRTMLLTPPKEKPPAE